MVAGGAGDNAASACGVGTVEPGAAFVSLGTSGVLFVSNERFLPNAASAVHAFCHALPNTWHQMGVILSAAASLEWLAQADRLRPRPSSTAALDGQSRWRGAAVLPALSLRRAHASQRRRRARQLRRALTRDRQRALTHAVIEGVAFAFGDCLEALKAAGTTSSARRRWAAARARASGSDDRERSEHPDRRAGGRRFRRRFRRGAPRPLRGRRRRPARGVHTAQIQNRSSPSAEPVHASNRLPRYRALYPAIKEVLKS